MKIDITQNKQTLNRVPGVCIKYPWLLSKQLNTQLQNTSVYLIVVNTATEIHSEIRKKIWSFVWSNYNLSMGGFDGAFQLKQH